MAMVCKHVIKVFFERLKGSYNPYYKKNGKILYENEKRIKNLDYFVSNST